MCRCDLGEIEDLSTDGRVHIVGAVLLRVGLKLARAEDVFRGANDRTDDGDDEDSATTHEPDEEVEGELLAPCLLNIGTLHPADVG